LSGVLHRTWSDYTRHGWGDWVPPFIYRLVVNVLRVTKTSPMVLETGSVVSIPPQLHDGTAEINLT